MEKIIVRVLMQMSGEYWNLEVRYLDGYILNMSFDNYDACLNYLETL